MNRDKILSMISIAAKAGKVASGEYSVDHEGKAGNAKLVILAEDASKRTIKSVSDMCEYYHIEYKIYGTKDSLGKTIGKENRSQLAILDEGLAGSILNLIRASQEE